MNPAPDLQDLVRKHGGYDKIPPEAWTEYDRAMAEWHECRRTGSADGPSSEAPKAERSDPGALRLRPSRRYWRSRKGGGRPIWRCEQHRNQRPDYVDGTPCKQAASGGVR
jgi:hypothetical protein